MPTRLRKLRIDKVALVPRGANQEAHVLLYKALGLTIAGLLVSGYHIILENGGAELIPCSTALKVSCTVKYVNIFNYITIPVMSFTICAALLAILIVVLRRKHWLPKKAKELSTP